MIEILGILLIACIYITPGLLITIIYMGHIDIDGIEIPMILFWPFGLIGLIFRFGKLVLKQFKEFFRRIKNMKWWSR